MLEKNLKEVNSMVNLAILAADEMDVLEGLSDMELITKTLNLRNFYSTLTSGIVSSISSLVSDDSMYYLKNSNKYLQLTIKLLNGSVSSGTPTADEIRGLRNASVKGLGSYIIFVLSAVGELSVTFEDNIEELDEYKDLYKEMLESMEELKELVDELKIIENYGEVDYNKEFNIEITFDDEEPTEETSDNGESFEREVSPDILKWATGVKQTIDFGSFEEEE